MDRTVYLINDLAWQDVLSLVPLTIWTEPPSQQPLRVKTITAANWVARKMDNARGVIQFRSRDGAIRFGELQGVNFQSLQSAQETAPLVLHVSDPLTQPERHLRIQIEGGTSLEVSLPQITLRPGEELTLHVATDGTTYADANLRQLVQAGPERTVHRAPTLVYYREEEGLDADSILRFLHSYRGQAAETKIIHLGALPEPLRVRLDSFGFETAQIEQGVSVLDLQQRALHPADGDAINTFVIVARDDYRSGLVAAAFASLRHALLFFVDQSNLDDYRDIETVGKEILFVGDVDKKAIERFENGARPVSCEELQRRYLDETLTQKLILVNPDDINAGLEVSEENRSLLQLLMGTIKSVYGRTSLVAPFLAAAKHELILPLASTNPNTIDQFVDDFVQDMEARASVQARFLTIVASPDAIPMAMAIGPQLTREDDVWVELDNRHYGSLGRNEEEVHLAVGRIFGITVSDCSAYVARVLFYDELTREPNQPARAALLVLLEDRAVVQPQSGLGGAVKVLKLAVTDDLASKLDEKYFRPDVAAQFDAPPAVYLGPELRPKNENDPVNQKPRAERLKQLRNDFKNATLILITGHADCNGYGDVINTVEHYNEEMFLNFPVIIGIGCRTSAYDWLRRDQWHNLAAQNAAETWLRSQSIDPPQPATWPETYQLTNLFVAQNIRRGAMSQQCSIDIAYFHEESYDLLRGLYVNGLSLGEAFRLAKNAEYQRLKANPNLDNMTSGKVVGDAQYVLVGDPTFTPHPKSVP